MTEERGRQEKEVRELKTSKRYGIALASAVVIGIAVMVIGVTAAAVSTASPAFADETATKWECEKKSKVFESYGAWKEAIRAYTDGGCKDSMSCRSTKKVSSTYTGELKVTIPKLESFALMTHKINKSFSVSVKYTTSLKGRKKGTWAIQYRPVYNCRNVTQRKYQKADKTWKKTAVTKKVKTKDYKSMAYRVVFISAKNKTGA